MGQRPSVLCAPKNIFVIIRRLNLTILMDWRWAGYNAYKMHNVVTTCAGVNFLFSFSAFDFFATTSTNFGSC